MTRVIIRADASQKIGFGHIMRCLALAEELRDKGSEVIFITRDHQGNLGEYIQSNNFKVYMLPTPSKSDLQQCFNEYEKLIGVKQEKDAEETIQVIKNQTVDWLIVDHYSIDQIWEKNLRPYTKKIMVIDDLANRKHDCDLLLDQNYIHDESRYDKLTSDNTTKLLGPKYALLRKIFMKYHKIKKQQKKELNRVFVFFGGSDLNNLTTTTLKVLEKADLQYLFIEVVIGATNLHQEEIKEYVSSNPRVKLHVQTDNIAEIMSNADISIGAGGSNTWERMVVGLPCLVVTTAENQVSFTRELHKDGYINWLGTSHKINQQIIHDALLDAVNDMQKMHEQSKKGKQLVKGNGAGIVRDLLMFGPNQSTLTIRRATQSDCECYWFWVNDTTVRESAINQNVIEWREHQLWFEKKLHCANSTLLVVESEFGPIGQVRFDRTDKSYSVDYSIDKLFRGYGLGRKILLEAIEYLKKEHAFNIRGLVRSCNLPSKKVFESLGFIETPISKGNRMHNFQLSYYPIEQ